MSLILIYYFFSSEVSYFYNVSYSEFSVSYIYAIVLVNFLVIEFKVDVLLF